MWSGGCATVDQKKVRRPWSIATTLHPIHSITLQRCISRGTDIISDPVPSHPHRRLVPVHSVQALQQLFARGHQTVELLKICIILAVATSVLNGKN